jgi:hypothetical protein
MIRTGLKLIGYKLGHMERRLPYGLKRRLSGNKQYWDQINLQQGSGA